MMQFEKIYKKDNPNFDHHRFRHACGYQYSQRKGTKHHKTTWGYRSSIRNFIMLEDIK